jgi:hypothetical protein
MTSLIDNPSHGRIRTWVELIQLPLQGGADETTCRVPLLLEGVELLLQLDWKLNNDANKLGHDQTPLGKILACMKLLHVLCLADISLTM